MVLSWLHANTFGLKYLKSLLNGVEGNDLIGDLPDLSFSIIHKASAEHVNLVLIGASGMAAATLEFFIAHEVIGYISPFSIMI